MKNSAVNATSSMKTGWTSDLAAGFLVSLIALPLSLGIAVASGFPAASGLIAAIVGGVITSLAGGARLTIKGPAAGLIVIVLGAVTELGDHGDPMSGVYRTAAAIVVAGGIQIFLGIFRCGVLAEMMPGAVIHGMLAAIGIIVMGKQIHVLLGVTPIGKTPLALISEVRTSLTSLNPVITFIGISSLAVMIVCARYPIGFLRRVPAVLIVMILAICLDAFFDLTHLHTYVFHGAKYPLGPDFHLKLPASVAQSLFTPDWSHLLTPQSLKYIAFLAIVGSIESLLTVSAVNGIDPERLRADSDKDLIALGIGNIVSGLFGGLPIISEIVRSKANVDAGATSSRANMAHGLLLLAYLGLMSSILSLVPLSALAGVLIYVGFRLASPREFMRAWNTGREQFVFFLTTCVLTVTGDILVGVAAGLACALSYVLVHGTKPWHLVASPRAVMKEGQTLKVELEGNAIFSNFASFRQIVEGVGPEICEIKIDFSKCNLVEHTFRDKLERLRTELSGMTISVSGLDAHVRSGSDPTATVRRP
jgi:MFS superfamily sulfate permease-like transporter